MALKAIYENQEEIPEPFRELYADKGGKYELTGIEGVKTQADIDRLTTSLTKERNEHKAAREALKTWGDLKYDEVRQQLDEIEELRIIAEGKGPDKEKQQQLLEAQLKTRLLPIERERETIKKELEETRALAAALKSAADRRLIQDEVRAARIKSKAREEAEDDIMLNAERMMEIVENADGTKMVVTRSGVGVTPGVAAEVWLGEMQGKRAYWWPESQGGGARGGGGSGGAFARNPWKPETTNYTERVRIANENPELAKQMARAAGVDIAGNPLSK